MPQVPAREFERLPLRVHAFLAGVSLHDVRSIDLPRWRAGVTLDEFLRATGNLLFTPSPLVRTLLDIRLFVGRIFGWDREPGITAWETFATRLSDADRSKSLAPDGTRDGFFSVVYRFENRATDPLGTMGRYSYAGQGKWAYDRAVFEVKSEIPAGAG